MCALGRFKRPDWALSVQYGWARGSSSGTLSVFGYGCVLA